MLICHPVLRRNILTRLHILDLALDERDTELGVTVALGLGDADVRLLEVPHLLPFAPTRLARQSLGSLLILFHDKGVIFFLSYDK